MAFTEEERKARKALRDKAYNEKNAETIKLKKAKYALEHKDQIIATAKRYREAHKDTCKERLNSWRFRNKDMATLQVNKRRAIRRLNGVFKVTKLDIQNQVSRQSGSCFWCKCKLDKYHVDHVIPLIFGGRHSIGNIVISCPSCNSKKGSKLPIEFKNMYNIKF